MVCEPSLAFCAREIELGSYLLLGKGEEATGGRQRPSVTSDAMEALIGAIYLDGGFTNAKEFIHRFILTDLENKKLFYDSKTILQEIVQADMEEGISYHLIKEEGPGSQQIFHCGSEDRGDCLWDRKRTDEKSSGTGSRLQGNSEAEKTKLKRVFYVFKMY